MVVGAADSIYRGQRAEEGYTGYNPEGVGETSQGDRDISKSRITTEGGTLRDSKDSAKDTRDLRLRDVA